MNEDKDLLREKSGPVSLADALPADFAWHLGGMLAEEFVRQSALDTGSSRVRFEHADGSCVGLDGVFCMVNLATAAINAMRSLRAATGDEG